MKLKKFLFMSLFIFLMVNVGYGSIFVDKFNYTSNIDLNKNPNFCYNISLANSENIVLSNLSMRFEFVNKDLNNVEFYRFSRNLSFYKYEAKILSACVNLPSNIPKGNYYLNFYILEKTGAPITGFKENVKIFNSKSNLSDSIFDFIENGPYLISEDNSGKILLESHGMLGNNIYPNTNVYLALNFKNNYNYKNNIIADIKLYTSYSLDNLVYEKKSNFEIENNVGKILLNWKKPGTYNVITTFYYNNSGHLDKLFSKRIRLVLRGASGGIINVFNKQDVYNPGNVFLIKGSLVGPADGATKLYNTSLNLLIIQNKKIIFNSTKKINNLGFEPVNFEFDKEVKSILNNYIVILTLKENNEILDQVKLSYEKLNPKYLYKDGLIYKPGMCLDDGVCTNEEKKIGNCLDCNFDKIKKIYDETHQNKDTNNSINESNRELNRNNNSNSYTLIFLIVFIISLFLIVSIIYIWRKNKNEN